MKKVLLLGIIGLVLLAGCQPQDATNTTSTTSSNTTDISSTMPNTTTSNISLSDFKACEEADSWKHYFNDTGGAYNADTEFVDLDNASPIAVPLKKNVAEARIYSIPRARAGGDVLTDPFLTIDTLYCPFTEKNARMLFSPITSPSEALNYTRLLTITLAGSAYGRDHSVIRDKEEYDNLLCPEVNTSQLSPEDRTVTDVEAVEDGFRVKLVTYTRSGTMGVYKRTITVSTDGVMNTKGEKELILECGQGMLY